MAAETQSIVKIELKADDKESSFEINGEPAKLSDVISHLIALMGTVVYAVTVQDSSKIDSFSQNIARDVVAYAKRLGATPTTENTKVN